MKPLIFLFLILLVLPLVSAQTELTFSFNDEVDLKRPCFNNGTFCSSSALCNITVIYPDGNLLLDNEPMTNQVSYFNKTIAQGGINQLGFYPSIMSCCDLGNCGADTFDIEVTGDGLPNQVFPIQFVIIILSFFLIGLGYFFDGLRMFKHVGSIILMILGVITLYPGYSFINYTTLFGKAIGFSAIGLGFYFLIEDSFSRDDQEQTYSEFSERRQDE